MGGVLHVIWMDGFRVQPSIQLPVGTSEEVSRLLDLRLDDCALAVA